VAAKRTLYYSDELHDDFARTNIKAREIGPDYPYVHKNILWRIGAFLLYYVLAVPLAFLISKVYLGLKFENRQVLRQLHHTGYFLYGNHTHMLDAFLPILVSFPKRAYVVTSPDAVSLPCLSNVVQMLGALPIPTKFSGMRGFLCAIRQRYAQGTSITIFPEAHIWPYYTGIRPFPDTSFRYPVGLGAPVVAMAVTYRKRRGLFLLSQRPGTTVTLSEPMYPKTGLRPKEAQAELRDRVYQFLIDTSQGRENVTYIAYQPREPEKGL
jgi:1-acyl-sn-glycerol-3-phosphate acyltransferase